MFCPSGRSLHLGCSEALSLDLSPTELSEGVLGAYYLSACKTVQLEPIAARPARWPLGLPFSHFRGACRSVPHLAAALAGPCKARGPPGRGVPWLWHGAQPCCCPAPGPGTNGRPNLSETPWAAARCRSARSRMSAASTSCGSRAGKLKWPRVPGRFLRLTASDATREAGT